MLRSIEIQGHRGCRGSLPENTMQGFYRCESLGVDFIEIDVVCSMDGKILVSHDPFFNVKFCDPTHLLQTSSTENNFMKLSSSDIQGLDVGLGDPDFPEQKVVESRIPSLEEVLNYLQNTYSEIGLNIEIKYDPFRPEFYPPVEVYCARIMKLVLGARNHIHMRIQSFSTEILKEIKGIYRWPFLGLLIEDYVDIDLVIEELGFTPSRWGVKHDMITEDLVDLVHARGMKIDAWTVNHEQEAKRLADIWVDSIITDYPEKMKGWLEP